jgi:hypothetical protein
VRSEVIAPDDPRWGAFLAHVEHDFYHVPGYVQLTADHEGGRAIALLVSDDTRAMLLPLILRPIAGSSVDAVSPYGYPCPLVRGGDRDFLQAAMQAAIDCLHEEHAVSLFVRFHPMLGLTPPEGIGTVVLHGQTVSVDLSLQEDVLWTQIRETFRRDIKKSNRLGHTVRTDPEWDHLATFGRLYRETMMRVGATRRFTFDDRYIERFRDVFGAGTTLRLVEIDGEVAAAALFVQTGSLVQYHLAGWDERFARFRPMKLMMQGAIEWAKQRGALRLHLGGGLGAANDSLMHFKAGFSPERHTLYTLRAVVDRPEYERLVGARDPSLDPGQHDGFFPQYRTED